MGITAILQARRHFWLPASLALLVALSSALLPSAADTNSSAAIVGFPSTLAARELEAERIANASPNAHAAMHDELVLAGHVHRMGQPADYQTAVYVRNRLAADGFDAAIVTYDVANVWPTEQHLDITAPFQQSVNLYEPAIASDPYSKNHEEIGKPYSGFSNDGDAEGPLIYANYGRAEDFALLKSMHVNLTGAIVIAKMGHGSADSKGRRVVSYGGKALLIYPEPGWDPYLPPKPGTKPYPNGPARPLGAALRNTMLIEYNAGDPTAIGIPVPGAKHTSFSTLRVPPIPVSAITALVAQQLEANLGGPLAPRAWATKTSANVRIGGVERVHYVLKSRRFIGPIWDVIATMKGTDAPSESVIIGGHRDAWTYGAVDPISGTVAMLQLGDAVRDLRKTGWRPFRTSRYRFVGWRGAQRFRERCVGAAKRCRTPPVLLGICEHGRSCHGADIFRLRDRRLDRSRPVGCRRCHRARWEPREGVLEKARRNARCESTRSGERSRALHVSPGDSIKRYRLCGHLWHLPFSL